MKSARVFGYAFGLTIFFALVALDRFIGWTDWLSGELGLLASVILVGIFLIIAFASSNSSGAVRSAIGFAIIILAEMAIDISSQQDSGLMVVGVGFGLAVLALGIAVAFWGLITLVRGHLEQFRSSR